MNHSAILARTVRTCLLAAALASLTRATAGAQLSPPANVTFQGRLTDSAGAPLTGSYLVTFNLYTADTGGAPVWTEVHANTPLQEGLFSVVLGTSSSLATLVFDQQYWLGVTVDGDPEMVPRYQLTAAPCSLSPGLPGATGEDGPHRGHGACQHHLLRYARNPWADGH